MENQQINDKNIFDFLTEKSEIAYKKFVFDFTEVQSTGKSLKNSYYFYDSFTNQFIYIFDDLVCIFNKKGKPLKKVILNPKSIVRQKIRYITCDISNKFLLIIANNNNVHLVEINKGTSAVYEKTTTKNPFIGFINGGFFFKTKFDKNNDTLNNSSSGVKKMKSESIYFCLISSIGYRIVEMSLIHGNIFDFKNIYISEKIIVSEYFFDNVFNVLILRNEYKGFYLINLKHKSCFDNQIDLKIKNVYFTSKFFLKKIYNKLYFIHFTENVIEFYRLNNIKKLKEPKVISFNDSQKVIDYELAQMQFHDNLIILYLGDNIRIYDLKGGMNEKMGKIDVPSSKKDIFFDKIKIYGRFLEFDDKNIYKIKFLSEVYKNNSANKEVDIFFTLLRRKNSVNIIKSVLFDILEKFEISLFYSILYKLTQNYIKSLKADNINQDRKNCYQIMYIGHNSFYLPQEELFSLFNNDFSNIESIKILKIMIIIYNEYKKLPITIDQDVFISTLFYQLNKIDDYSKLDFIIKNFSVPINNKLGLYFIDRSKFFNDPKKKEISFNLGIQLLLADRNNLNQVLIELIDEKKYFECIDEAVDSSFSDKNVNKDLINENKNQELLMYVVNKIKMLNKGKKCKEIKEKEEAIN